jgi:hypothetical protein
MKTKASLIIAIIVLVSLAFIYVAKKKTPSNDSTQTESTQVQSDTPNSEKLSNLSLYIESYGITVLVSSDGQSLVANDQTNKVKWDVDIIQQHKGTLIGEPRIRHLSLNNNGQIIAIYGKHSAASIDPTTGIVTYLGSD